MNDIVAKAKALLNKVADALEGNPVRVILYGAAVIIYLVANAFGRLPDVTFDQALVLAAGAIGTLVLAVEKARSLVTPV